MEWITANINDLWLIVASVVTVASLIAKLTPNTLDDKIIGKILKLISINK